MSDLTTTGGGGGGGGGGGWLAALPYFPPLLIPVIIPAVLAVAIIAGGGGVVGAGGKGPKRGGLLGKNGLVGRLLRNLLGKDSILALLYKNLLGKDSLIGMILRAILLDKDSLLANLLDNWFGPESLLGRFIKRLLSPESAVGQLIADKESVIGQMVDKLFGSDSLMGQLIRDIFRPSALLPASREKVDHPIRKKRRVVDDSQREEFWPFSFLPRKSGTPAMSNGQVDDLTSEVFLSSLNPECIRRLICEAGKLSRRLSDSTTHSSLTDKSFKEAVPDSMKKGYDIFIRAANCDQYKCGSHHPMTIKN